MKTAIFKSENGFYYKFPENHCVFCKNCGHILYDYTNGPYMFTCDFGNDKLNIQKEIYGILSGKVGRIDDPYVEKALIRIEKALTKIQDYINKE